MPQGLFRFKHLSLDISKAIKDFTRIINELLFDTQGVFTYLDDILVSTISLKELAKRII